MKKTRSRRRILGIMLALAMMLGLMPQSGFTSKAANEASSWTVNSDGTYSLSQTAVTNVIGNTPDSSVTLVLIGTLGTNATISGLPSGATVHSKTGSNSTAALILFDNKVSNAELKTILTKVKFAPGTTRVHIDLTTGETTADMKEQVASDTTTFFGVLNSNGEAHAYQFKKGQKNWIEAFHEAMSGTDTLGGLKGYLATVTTQDEAVMLKGFFDSANTGNTNGAWTAGTSMKFGANDLTYETASKITPTNHGYSGVATSVSNKKIISEQGTYYMPFDTTHQSNSTYADYYYWACGPEQGQSMKTAPWASGEPNNSDDAKGGESCAVAPWGGNALLNDLSPNAEVHGYFLEFSVYAGGIDAGVNYQSKNIYFVKYDGNGNTSGTAPAPQEKLSGSALSVAKAPEGFEQEGYTFTGWNTKADGSGTAYAAGAAYDKDETVTLYAQWKKDDKPKDVTVDYVTHVQNKGWDKTAKKDGQVSGTTGSSLRMEAIAVKLEGNPNLGVQYATHVQDLGWTPWATNGEVSGTTNESKRLEAVMMKLTGTDAEKYDIYYRVHVQNLGWLNWAKNGQPAGSSGFGYRLEAIQIQVVPKGTAVKQNAEGVKSTSTVGYSSKDKNNAPEAEGIDTVNVSYRTHIQNAGWQNWKSNGAVAGSYGRSLRLEGINLKLTNKDRTGGIRYKTHIQNLGWEKNWHVDGDTAGTTGRSLRLEAIDIELYGDMADFYDVYYRVHVQNYGWLNWAKNGEHAGTAGLKYRMEGIQVVIVPKEGTEPAANYGNIKSVNTKAFIQK